MFSTIAISCDYTDFCLFLPESPNVCDILFVFRLKGIFFTKQNGPLFFLVAIYSCSRDWYWNFSMFVDELWNNKKKTQSLLARNQKVRAEAEVWGTSNQFSQPCMHLNVCWAQSRHDTLGGKQSGTTQNRLLALTKKVDWGRRTIIIIHFCFLSSQS